MSETEIEFRGQTEAQWATVRVMLDDAAPALLAAHAVLSARLPATLPAVARQPVARISAALAMHIRDLAELKRLLPRGG
jgi:hypothetical protein